MGIFVHTVRGEWTKLNEDVSNFNMTSGTFRREQPTPDALMPASIRMGLVLVFHIPQLHINASKTPTEDSHATTKCT